MLLELKLGWIETSTCAGFSHWISRKLGVGPRDSGSVCDLLPAGRQRLLLGLSSRRALWWRSGAGIRHGSWTRAWRRLRWSGRTLLLWSDYILLSRSGRSRVLLLRGNSFWCLFLSLSLNFGASGSLVAQRIIDLLVVKGRFELLEIAVQSLAFHWWWLLRRSMPVFLFLAWILIFGLDWSPLLSLNSTGFGPLLLVRIVFHLLRSSWISFLVDILCISLGRVTCLTLRRLLSLGGSLDELVHFDLLPFFILILCVNFWFRLWCASLCHVWSVVELWLLDCRYLLVLHDISLLKFHLHLLGQESDLVLQSCHLVGKSHRIHGLHGVHHMHLWLNLHHWLHLRHLTWHTIIWNCGSDRHLICHVRHLRLRSIHVGGSLLLVLHLDLLLHLLLSLSWIHVCHSWVSLLKSFLVLHHVGRKWHFARNLRGLVSGIKVSTGFLFVWLDRILIRDFWRHLTSSSLEHVAAFGASFSLATKWISVICVHYISRFLFDCFGVNLKIYKFDKMIV